MTALERLTRAITFVGLTERNASEKHAVILTEEHGRDFLVVSLEVSDVFDHKAGTDLQRPIIRAWRSVPAWRSRRSE